MTSTELDALVALGEGITPGPWGFYSTKPDPISDERFQITASGLTVAYLESGLTNARAIAAVPDLIAAIITLRKSEDELREAVRLFPTACDVLARQEMKDAKGNLRSLIDQQTAALAKMRQALSNTEGGV